MVMDRPTPIEPTQISRANPNLGERLFKEGVRLAYDEDGDTLFVTIGEPRPAIATPFIDGIYIQVEPLNYRIVGCTVLSFASDFLAKNKLMRKMFPNALEALRASPDNTIELTGQEAGKTKPLFDAVLSR